MREQTVEQAEVEVKTLDLASETLRQRLNDSYETLRNRPDLQHGDVESAVAIYNTRAGLKDALEELAKRGYGRVVVLDEVDEAGRKKSTETFRVSQANASLVDSPIRIVARNSQYGSKLASCRVGDEIEIVTKSGEKFFDVKVIVDLEGVAPLLKERPDVALARFSVAHDTNIDVVRELRAFVGTNTSAPALIRIPSADAIATAPTTDEERKALFWPSNWENIILANEEAASLGAQFFTRTTSEQENAIRAVRGVTLVEGVAGTGKTSVALGRLKFFANFRSGENLEEYNLNPNDWADFNPHDMIGFVLSPSLVHYLRQTAERLELGAMKIQDFDEYRDQERQQRRLFGRPFKKSPDRNIPFFRTVTWLAILDAAASPYISDAIAEIQRSPLLKPDSSDGKAISDSRWKGITEKYWERGPLHARLTGWIRRFGSTTYDLGRAFRLQRAVSGLDQDVRLSDRETDDLETGERRVLREAVENVALRIFRLFNPTELLPQAYSSPAIEAFLSEARVSDSIYVLSAAKEIANRFKDNFVSDDDVVTALCLNAILCDRFERDIAAIPYLREFSERVAVFIDEFQDFNEQQVFLMGYRAKSKYRQITVAGDRSQCLHSDGLENVMKALPFQDTSPRSIFLDVNHRQAVALAKFSQVIREIRNLGALEKLESAFAPVISYAKPTDFAEAATRLIDRIPGMASIAVICPDRPAAEFWYELMKAELEELFREPVLSDRARLTERFRTHFTTPLDAKGLEFDVVIVPDISTYPDTDAIAMNGLYVAVSRPKYSLILGCPENKNESGSISNLLKRKHMFRVTASSV